MTYSKFMKVSLAAMILAAPIAATQNASAQVFTQDVIVQGSLCAGFDCATGESFGFDTIRLKENNLRINFQDTSTSASFPTVDWTLVANDSSNGGANYFSILNVDTGQTPFRVDSGANTNALRVDAQGDVGIGTGTPVVELHITDGDSPTVRIEQDGSSGFGAQTWDIAGNETNFFVRDITNGNTLPFKIIPSTPSDRLVLTSGGVGVAERNPSASLHVGPVSGKASILLDGGTATTPANSAWDFSVRNSDGELALNDSLTSGGDFVFKTADTAANTPWEFVHRADNGFGLNTGATSGAEFILSSTGNLTVSGTITSTGPTCASGCDAVFDEDYDLPTIEDHAEAMFANRHLPTVGPTSRDNPINLTEHMGNVLNELEKAHIFIAQLNERNKKLEARLEQIEQSID